MSEIIHHTNNSNCGKCEQIFMRYQGFHTVLKAWFKQLQKDHPEAHISCAGRSSGDQNELFIRKATEARYPHSAHNWNCAIDLFCMKVPSPTISQMYDKDWFMNVMAPKLTKEFVWYGRPGAPFYELPHVEVLGWDLLAGKGVLRKVMV